jgi:hypothetical protein
LHSRGCGLKPDDTREEDSCHAIPLHTIRHAARYNCTYNNRSNNNINDALRRRNYNNRNKYNNDNDDNIYERSSGRNETRRIKRLKTAAMHIHTHTHTIIYIQCAQYTYIHICRPCAIYHNNILYCRVHCTGAVAGQ